MSRTASTTRAPLAANSRAVTRPMPLLAPVTTTVRPVWSGMSAKENLEVVMGNKVGSSNTVVNAYIRA
ncbi:hypothetical protein GCM10011594_34030 [Nakamurella endophytica]|uniref:Uncharacterized protein n=1 Tax=Nakamurella endophytica TaxID=1748367 RepID=A0A917WKZ0_9ACTN|nr:hypothetical protein GCM10011594_34030 [Nakamurella endophytica]